MPVPAEINPRAAFERLFGDGESTDPAVRMSRLEGAEKRAGLRHGFAVRLQGRLGAGDKRKLDEYLESVRDIERRIQLAERQNGQTQLPLMDRPSAIPQDYGQYSRLMMDLWSSPGSLA